MADQKTTQQHGTNLSVTKQPQPDTEAPATEPVKHSWWWKVGVGLTVFEVGKHLIQWLWPVVTRAGWLRVVLILLGVALVGFLGLMLIGYIVELNERRAGTAVSEATSPADDADVVAGPTTDEEPVAESAPVKAVQPEAVVTPTVKVATDEVRTDQVPESSVSTPVVQPETSVTHPAVTMTGIDQTASSSPARIATSKGYATKPVQQYTFNLTQPVRNKQPETRTQRTRQTVRPQTVPFWQQGWFIKLSFIAVIIIGLHFLSRALIGPADSVGDDIMGIGAVAYYLFAALLCGGIVLWIAYSIIIHFLDWLWPGHFIKKDRVRWSDPDEPDPYGSDWQDGYDNGMIDSWAMHDHDDDNWDDPY